MIFFQKYKKRQKQNGSFRSDFSILAFFFIIGRQDRNVYTFTHFFREKVAPNFGSYVILQIGPGQLSRIYPRHSRTV